MHTDKQNQQVIIYTKYSITHDNTGWFEKAYFGFFDYIIFFVPVIVLAVL
jgi:hypothetical protein